MGAELITEELVAEHLAAALAALAPELDRPAGEGCVGPSEPAKGPALTASVAISGAWNGLVSLQVTEPAARALAQAVFAVPQVGFEDLADAVGELVNIVGGNLKGLLPAPTQLSLPTVATGTISVPGRLARGQAHLGRALVVDLDLAWLEGPLRLTVWEGPEVCGSPG
ncbi:chemotaxis protein CheX [Aciditerrimonas ferrireducens]|uniref:chemotaxis protein CheX n=1 Tax=Aciditerrimonas ferrireducens TaxID=667306 RepID=UPI0020061AE4|nr:chemotaxis protein CheX [Aciditerrimonas ferrireducens]MCK4176679.1 chemotaxis protein CheX [Aciditerrimonas ferrireducens]